MNPYVSLSDLTLAVTVLLTIIAVMITVARRLGWDLSLVCCCPESFRDYRR